MEYIAVHGVKPKTRIKLTIEEYEKLSNLFNGLEPLRKTKTFIYFELDGDYSNELKT
jgi:hypothetical protein